MRGVAFQSVRLDEFVVWGIFACPERADEAGHGSGNQVDHFVAAELFDLDIERGLELIPIGVGAAVIHYDPTRAFEGPRLFTRQPSIERPEIVPLTSSSSEPNSPSRCSRGASAKSKIVGELRNPSRRRSCARDETQLRFKKSA